jgi:hypothetical protein
MESSWHGNVGTDKRDRRFTLGGCVHGRRALQAPGVDSGPPRVRMAIGIRRRGEMRCIIKMIGKGSEKVKLAQVDGHTNLKR